MPSVALTVTPGPHPYSQVGKAPTFAAADASDGNHIPAAAVSNDMLVIFRNSGGTSRTITITSSPLGVFARTGNVNESLAGGATKVFRLRKDGWVNVSTGDIVLGANHADVLIAVLDLTKQETT